MNRLSNPIENLRDNYDIVVIGSGYGGSISANRLARAGKAVCILERGREILPGEYPDTPKKMSKEIQINTSKKKIGSKLGLFDFDINEQVNVIKGCGLGGTSLINANVSIMPDKSIFTNGAWPKEIVNDLDNIYNVYAERARDMLRPVSYPEDFPELVKLTVLEKMAAYMQKPFFRLPINVTFKTGPNHVGVEQKACINCGDCVTGCNHYAKNTLIMNYLPDAKNHGASIFTCIQVTYIEKETDGWYVHIENTEPGRTVSVHRIKANKVIVAAGTLGSTEILLRSKIKGLSLSDRVGFRFSGNGDYIGFGYNTTAECNSIGFGNRNPEGRQPVGPCITGIIDMRKETDVHKRLIIEDCSMPGATATYLMVLGLALATVPLGKETGHGIKNWIGDKWRQLVSLLCGPYKGAVRNTQGFLTASIDDGAGVIYLKDDRPRINWPDAGHSGNYKAVNEDMYLATKAFKGNYIRNPLWNKLLGYDLISAHPLGGCIMADDATTGVVNHKCQVYSGTSGKEVYQGLYVMDGSVIPSALCANPLLTISSIAERGCSLMANDEGMSIPY
ncbi:MAG: GMC family oxidoreductase N-terminal domain-containing protein [Chitinophagaceae bacterium]